MTKDELKKAILKAAAEIRDHIEHDGRIALSDRLDVDDLTFAVGDYVNAGEASEYLAVYVNAAFARLYFHDGRGAVKYLEKGAATL